jgi:hypothetical protein
MITSRAVQVIRPEQIERKFNYPAANTAAVITLTAQTDKRWVIHGISWSYSGAPTGGRLSITFGGVTEFDIDIASSGVGETSAFLSGGINQAVVITLAAGGVGITGKLNAQVMQYN